MKKLTSLGQGLSHGLDIRDISTAHQRKLGAVGSDQASADGPWAPLIYFFDVSPLDWLLRSVQQGMATARHRTPSSLPPININKAWLQLSTVHTIAPSYKYERGMGVRIGTYNKFKLKLTLLFSSIC